MIVLPNKSDAAVKQFAENICNSVKRLSLTHEQSPFGMVTVSIGVMIRADFADSVSSELIECADKALYRAKSKGRNQVDILY